MILSKHFLKPKGLEQPSPAPKKLKTPSFWGIHIHLPQCVIILEVYPLTNPRRNMKIRIVSQSRITLLGISISHPNAHLKINFLFPRWHMLVPWRVPLVQPFVNCFSHGEIPHGKPTAKNPRSQVL